MEELDVLSLTDFSDLITGDELGCWGDGGLSCATFMHAEGAVVCHAGQQPQEPTSTGAPAITEGMCQQPVQQQQGSSQPSLLHHSLSPNGSCSPTLGSAASIQHLVMQHGSSSAPRNAGFAADPTALTADDEQETSSHGASGRPPSHSSTEKQRRDRLNSLIENLAAIVPPYDERYTGASGAGVRRPKHVVLLDAIRTVRALQEHMQQCSTAPAAHTPSPPPSATAERAHLERQSTLPHAGTSLDMPLPLDISNDATGVMVEAEPGAGTWILRVTCRDRPGLLADVTAALRSLPLTIRAASVTTTPSGKAQQVYDVQLLDATLSPEEVQCAVNAALYAHLLAAAPAAAAKPASSQPVPVALPQPMALMLPSLPSKRSRHV